MRGVLTVRDLKRHFGIRQRRGLFGTRQVLKAVDGLSFEIARGEMLGIVGESGCGKSTTARLLLGHLPPSSGEVRFGGEIVSATEDAAWRRMRRRMQMIYQDPLGALDPRLPIARQIEEPLVIHHPDISEAVRRRRVEAAMDDVGLSDYHGGRYPHELSGGQRQRAVIARALVLRPELLVCDEPVSALDVSVQAQVLNVIEDVRERTEFTGVFISHDLKVVRLVADRVAVMYLGRIVEIGEPDEVLHSPAHPYTKALVSAVPTRNRAMRDRIILSGEPPNPISVPTGCPFHPRCREARPICRELRPELIASGSRSVACHNVNAPVDTIAEVA